MAMRVPVKRACRVWAALWIGFVATTAYVVPSPSSWAQNTLTPEAKEALQEGIAAAKFQNWDSAQKHFFDAYYAAPEAPEIYFNLGLLNDRKGGAELVASAWYRAYLATVPTAQNRTEIEARLIDLHASAEARAAKYMATAMEVNKLLSDTPVDGDSCPGKVSNPLSSLLGDAVISGQFESIDEVIGWFQGKECQNDLLFSVVTALSSLKQPREAYRYGEKISGQAKVTTLYFFAVNRWREGDKTGAVKLVEEAEALATQLLKGAGKSVRGKYDAMRLNSYMAAAWCIVGNVAKALRYLERLDPNRMREATGTPYGPVPGWSSNDGEISLAHKIVIATLLSTGKKKEAKAVLRAIISKARNNEDRGIYQRSLGEFFDKVTNKPVEHLIQVADDELSSFYFVSAPQNNWLDFWEKYYSVKSARESGKTEQVYWRELATVHLDGNEGVFALDGTDGVYIDGEKFLAYAGSDPENTSLILHRGSANLLLGSRKIKEIAEAWRKEGADPAQ